ncbi:uncharacterized protein GGS25DRAFT_256557 [Hypoxylon fragiforme]|uniref:uncharacterized protein n=1 Tax=Hypoxylon fragiforme TaxID=63214 RepID=UPI0020C6AE89|nr:uncharacterized protein GGS25DRAFT_256557 [Hypoxylon fragiforme]KAI2610334.1 hypothetical protein GGS25DRAFT_256557 [Hypoxylon fragiforme]
MLAPLTVDLFYHIILVIYLVIFIFLHANRIRFYVLAMADMMNPQTPPRKLFKPSSKTKMPTPVRKRPTTPTPSSAQSHAVFTPTETISRNTERSGIFSRRSSEATQRAFSSSGKEDDISDKSYSAFKSIAGKPREILSPSTDSLPGPSNPTDSLNSPTDIAKYFLDQGNTEMSSFITALTGKTPNDQKSTTSNSGNSDKGTEDPVAETSYVGDQAGETPNTIQELPRDDALVASPSDRTKEAIGLVDSDPKSKSAGGADEKKIASGQNTDTEELQELAGAKDLDQDEELADTTPKPASVSKEAEGVTSNPEDQSLGAMPTNTMGKPDTASISKNAQVEVSNAKDKVNGVNHAATNGVEHKSATSSPKPPDNTHVIDNMGKPAHIERRVEIPLPRPEKVVSSPPPLDKPDASNIEAGLGDAADLPGTDGLPSVDELPKLSDETSQDPPEEILDPSVHSPSSNITPIPKIPKVTPIGMAPPLDLPTLAQNLGGNEVDDVGNIVDASGKVLGHATGDLPAMVGRKVSDNGEIYGERGELIGYVSENFTNPQPPPSDIPDHVLGGLKVDHDGNILDSDGNIIGRFNEKAGKNGNLAPFLNRSKTGDSQTEEKNESNEESKPKVNAHTGGSPSDIFLDVKSTTDGIQLTIRIPTTFQRQPQNS